MGDHEHYKADYAANKVYEPDLSNKEASAILVFIVGLAVTFFITVGLVAMFFMSENERIKAAKVRSARPLDFGVHIQPETLKAEEQGALKDIDAAMKKVGSEAK